MLAASSRFIPPHRSRFLFLILSMMAKGVGYARVARRNYHYWREETRSAALFSPRAGGPGAALFVSGGTFPGRDRAVSYLLCAARITREPVV